MLPGQNKWKWEKVIPSFIDLNGFRELKLCYVNEDWNYLYQPDSKLPSSSIPRHSKKGQNTFLSFSNAYWRHRWLKMRVSTLCMNRQSCCFSLITASIVWYVKSNCSISSVFMLFCVNSSLVWAISSYKADEAKFWFKEKTVPKGFCPLFWPLRYLSHRVCCSLTQCHRWDLKLEDWQLDNLKTEFNINVCIVLKFVLY